MPKGQVFEEDRREGDEAYLLGVSVGEPSGHEVQALLGSTSVHPPRDAGTDWRQLR